MLILPGGKGVYNQTLLVQTRMWRDSEPTLLLFSCCPMWTPFSLCARITVLTGKIAPPTSETL